ncbi:MAG: cytochrome c [Bryobacteraceae bacterium]
MARSYLKFAPAVVLAAFSITAASGQQYQMVATSKQLMAAVQKPAMDSLAALMKAGGPKDEKEWAVAEQSAAVLAETAQLLLLGTRPLDQDVWIKSSHRMNAAASASAKAAHDKDLAAWKASLGSLGASCKSCHSVHKKPKQ